MAVCTPLFTKYHAASEVAMLVFVFMAMTTEWCALGYYLVNHPLLWERIQCMGHFALPFVVIGLGLYILGQAFLLRCRLVDLYSVPIVLI
ncbi:MAG: hypothetical protein ACJ70X_02305 [Nitrososphaera sp.]